MGRIALPLIAFSTAGTSTRSLTFSSNAMIICASPITVAAPPMSFFINCMPEAGLIFSPPVSKHTPLPTSVSCGPALPQRISNRRGARTEARPTAWIIGKLSSSALPLVTSALAPKRLASARNAASSSSGPMSEAGVLIRSRVRNSPSAIASSRAASTPSGTSAAPARSALALR